jgi:hypothetical protein
MDDNILNTVNHSSLHRANNKLLITTNCVYVIYIISSNNQKPNKESECGYLALYRWTF